MTDPLGQTASKVLHPGITRGEKFFSGNSGVERRITGTIDDDFGVFVRDKLGNGREERHFIGASVLCSREMLLSEVVVRQDVKQRESALVLKNRLKFWSGDGFHELYGVLVLEVFLAGCRVRAWQRRMDVLGMEHDKARTRSSTS